MEGKLFNLVGWMQFLSGTMAMNKSSMIEWKMPRNKLSMEILIMWIFLVHYFIICYFDELDVMIMFYCLRICELY